MKRPFEAVLELFSNNLSKSVDNDKHAQEFLHNFMIWLIGFSIGALYLIVSNFVPLKSVFPYWTLKIIIITISTAIISGILQRLILFLFQVQYNSNLFYVEGALSNKVLMQDNPTDVSNESDIATLINLLKNDFGVDESLAIMYYNQADTAGKQTLVEYLRKKYTDTGAWAVRDYQIVFAHIDDVMKEAFGYNQNELEILKKTSSNQVRTLRKMSNLMLYLSCGSFIVSILILAIAY